MKHVFLVDDDRSVNFYNRWMLEKTGLNLTINDFSSSEAALEFLAQTMDVYPDFILLDLNLPGMNGLDFIKALGARFPDRSLPIIVLLMNSRLLQQTESEARTVGVTHFRNKPLEEADLNQFLKELNINE